MTALNESSAISFKRLDLFSALGRHVVKIFPLTSMKYCNMCFHTGYIWLRVYFIFVYPHTSTYQQWTFQVISWSHLLLWLKMKERTVHRAQIAEGNPFPKWFMLSFPAWVFSTGDSEMSLTRRLSHSALSKHRGWTVDVQSSFLSSRHGFYACVSRAKLNVESCYMKRAWFENMLCNWVTWIPKSLADWAWTESVCTLRGDQCSPSLIFLSRRARITHTVKLFSQSHPIWFPSQH